MNPTEPAFDWPPRARPEPPDWQHGSRSQRLESIAISVWSWTAVVALSVWFCLWLIEGLARMAARIPR